MVLLDRAYPLPRMQDQAGAAGYQFVRMRKGRK